MHVLIIHVKFFLRNRCKDFFPALFKCIFHTHLLQIIFEYETKNFYLNDLFICFLLYLDKWQKNV